MGKFLLVALFLFLTSSITQADSRAAVILLPPTPPCGSLTGTTIDAMEAVGDWQIRSGNNAVGGTLTSAAGYSGQALQLHYDFGPRPTVITPGQTPIPWVQFRRDFNPPLNLTTGDHLRFLHRGSNRNTIEIGLVAPDDNDPDLIDEIYFGSSWNESTGGSWWSYATWDLKDLKQDGQPFPDFAQVKAIFVSVVGSTPESDFQKLGIEEGDFLIDQLQLVNLASRSIPSNFETVSISPAVRNAAAGWIAARQQPGGLLKSWQEESFNFAYTYDQGVALIVLANTDLPKARLLVERLRQLQNADGSWYHNYDYGTNTPVISAKRDIGPIAWIVLGLMRYYALEPDGDKAQLAYTDAAQGAAWIAAQQRSDGSVRIVQNGTLQEPITEWNLSAWWAFQSTGYQVQADRLRDYLLGQVWDSGMGRFKSSTVHHRIFLDAQTWGAAFLRANGLAGDARKALSYAHGTLVTTSSDGSLCGFDGAGPFSVWNEGTLQYIDQGGENSTIYLQDMLDQAAEDGGIPNSPDTFSGYIIWLSPWHGIAPTAWLYFAATDEPFKITPPVIHGNTMLRNYFTTATPTLTWGRVSWAREYEIQVDSSSAFSDPDSYTATAPDASAPTTHLADGVYYWRVRAKADNRVSLWSATDSFVVDVP
ncbi:MAG: hypothetical protein K8L97_13730 [Anaerolineae bacterium]|nr:hypothetical protein [Anaerolineae bacterium]